MLRIIPNVLFGMIPERSSDPRELDVRPAYGRLLVHF